jgi:hypothetical protein
MGKAQKLPRIDVYVLGPEQDGISTCLHCGQPIQVGELWVKEFSPDSEYAVGVHTTCRDYAAQAADWSECGLCGYLAKHTAAMALHFRFVHHMSFGVGLDTSAA